VKSNTLSNTLLVFVLLGGIATLQARYDTSSNNLHIAEVKATLSNYEPLIPSTNALRILSLGRPEVASDLLWLSAIQYFGSVRQFVDYKSLAPLMDRVTELDPKFEYPYEMSLIVLPYMNASDTAVKLGLRAQENIPNNGLLTYYLATVYHINLHNYRTAAKYYQLAAEQPDAPAAAKQLAGVALSSVDSTIDDRKVAMEFWYTVYQNAKNPIDKDRAEKWFNQLSITYNLEQAAQSFHDKNDRYPDSVQELKDSGAISEIPSSPIGRAFVIDPKTGKVSFGGLSQE
jgi:tetratricopeptide (TPR) repeat protein